MSRAFQRFTDWTSEVVGTPWAFGLAAAVVLVWFAAGFLVGFDNTLYQLAINTGTTIVTFLMTFVIQATQNRSDHATQLKLDELILQLKGPEDRFAGIERLSQEELDRLEGAVRAEAEARAGKT